MNNSSDVTVIGKCTMLTNVSKVKTNIFEVLQKWLVVIIVQFLFVQTIGDTREKEVGLAHVGILKFYSSKSGKHVVECQRLVSRRVHTMPVSQLIWTPVDFDPRSISTSRYGLPGPNLLRRYGPPGSISTSGFGPHSADLDPLFKTEMMRLYAM